MRIFSLIPRNSVDTNNFLTDRTIFWKKKIQKITWAYKIFTKKYSPEKKWINNFEKKFSGKIIFNAKNNWIWELSIGVFSLFFGFFSATSAITIIGSVADWDPLAAAVLLCWIEIFTKLFYSTQNTGVILKILNSFKIGIILGMFVDAFKLTG